MNDRIVLTGHDWANEIKGFQTIEIVQAPLRAGLSVAVYEQATRGELLPHAEGGEGLFVLHGRDGDVRYRLTGRYWEPGSYEIVRRDQPPRISSS